MESDDREVTEPDDNAAVPPSPLPPTSSPPPSVRSTTLPSLTAGLAHLTIQISTGNMPGSEGVHGSSLVPGEVGAASPFSPTITPVGTPRELIPPAGPLPYDGDADLEKAIRMAMKHKDTAAWKLLIKARTVRNNLPTTGGGTGMSAADAARLGEELRPALTKLGWTENEVKWAQAKADGDLVEGIKLLLKEETSTHHHSNSDGGGEDDQEEDEEDDKQHNQQYQQLNGSSHQQQHRRRGTSVSEGAEVAVTSSILRRLSIDSTWQLLQSTSRTTGDEAAHRKAWMRNALLLVQVSSLQRQGRLSLPVKKKMKIAVAHGLRKEVEALLKIVQQQARHHRDSVDREDSLFTSYKCPLTDDLLYEPVTLVCGHTFSKRALEGVLSSGNRACPICRKPISVADADELKVNILMRDTITRLFSDRILQLVKHDISCLKPGNIELAAEEIFFIIERYKSNEDIVDLAVHTLLVWTREKRNLAPLSRRGLGREVLALLRMPALRASPKFLRRTAVAGLQVLRALGSGSTHGAKILSEGAVWATALSLLLEKPKVKGPELAALAAEAFKLVALAIKANQESAAMRLDPCLLAHQILGFALAHQQEASKEMVIAALRLVNDLMLLARIKGTQHYVLGRGDARQVLGLWFVWGRAGPAATAAIAAGAGAKGVLVKEACSAGIEPAPEVVREVASLFSTALFLQKHGIDTEEDLASVLVQAGTVQLGLEALVAFSEDTELLLAVVPLLLRLGFSPGLEANIIREEVCHQLKAPTFLMDVTRYLERLEEKALHADSPETLMVFEKASSHRIDIQENGVKVMANGKGWVVGSAIGAGTSVLTYKILQEDKGDECSCLGISLVEDPPITAEYRSTGSPFITLRCFSGEVYRDSRVLHASEALKVHPGGVVRIFIDMEAGTMSFQVNDGPPVLVASDLKGRTIYPAAYFYLGEPQPDRSTHPIIRMAITGSQVAKTLAIAVDAALAFTFPTPLPALIDSAGRRSRSGSACLSPLHQEGQIIRRRGTDVTIGTIGTNSDETALHEDPLFRAYCYGVGPGVTSGIHTYVFKASPILSICFGMVASDAVEPVLRLGPGPPEGIRTPLLVTLWSSGRVSSGGLREGLRPVPYDAQDFVKAEEPVTVRVRLEGRENVLEVVRGARVIHVVEQLDRCLPNGQALHPFVGLLSANDSISIEYRVSSPMHALGSEGIPDRKAWTLKAQSALQELGQARCDSRTPPLQSPTRLSLSATFQYLEEAAGPYKPISLLEELKVRARAGGLKADVLSDIAWNICRSVSRGVNWESNVRDKALQILASLPHGLEEPALVVGNGAGGERGEISENLGNSSRGGSNGGSGGFLVPAGALGLIVASNQDGRLTPGGLDLLTSLLGPPPCSPIFQAYARELGIVPLLLATMDGGSSRTRDVSSGADPIKDNSDGDRSLDLLLLLLQGPAAPLEAIRSEVLSLGLFRTLLEHLAARYVNTPPQAMALRRNLLQVIVELVAGKDWNQESLLSELLQMGSPVTAANPFLVQRHTLNEPASTAALMTGAVASAPGAVLSPNLSTGPSTISSGSADILLQRHKATKLQGGWQGHVSQSGEASTSWQDATFWALKDGDLDMLRVLLAAPYSVPFIADRVIFAPAWPGPWRGVLSEPVTMLGALLALARTNQAKEVEEMKALLETRAQAYRRQKSENLDDKPSILASQPLMSFLRHPNADGTLGTFAVDVQATEPFGFHHNDLVYAAAAPQWGYARVLGVQSKRLWLQFQGCLGAVTCPSTGWAPLDLRLVRARREAGGCGTSTTFRLPLERGTRVVRGPHWEWGIQDAFAGNLGTVLGNGGGDGWYRVMWDTSHTSNSYQYMPEHQDISRFNDPLGDSLSTLFPSLPAGGSDYVDGRELGEEEENVQVCESSLNVVTYAGEALADAGMDGLLDLLHNLWPKEGTQWDDEEHVHQRHLLWTCVARLGIRNPARMAKIVGHPSAQPLISAATYQLQHPEGEQGVGHLFFLVVAARHGSNAVLSVIEGALPYLLQLVATPTSSTRAVVLSLSVINSLICHYSQGTSALRVVAYNLREDHGALHAMMRACLQRVLVPTRQNPYAAAHILAMRFLRSLFETDPGVLHMSKNEEVQLEQLQEEFVTLLETYATLAFPKTMIEELLLLLLAWTRASAVTNGGETDQEKWRLAEERGAEVTLLARALLDEFEAANETLLHAPRQVLLAAPSILRRALTAQKEISLRERSVNLFLWAGTLGLLFQGDYEWTSAEKGHVTALCAFLQTLLEAAPGRKESIITLPLMRDLMPVLLDDKTDLAVTKAILQAYVSRLPEEEIDTEPVVAAATAGSRRGNWRGNSENGGSSGSRSGSTTTSISSTSKDRTFWTSIGPNLTHALCVTYKRVMEEQTTASLALTLLASVVQETRSLEQKDLEILLYSSPRSLPAVSASEGGAEFDERYDDGSVAQIAAKLSIIGMACHSFETDVQVDTDALVVRVVQWLQAHVNEQCVVEAALHLLQLLVDSTHVLLPEKVILSSGSLCTKSLFVAPPSSRHAPHNLLSYHFPAPTLSSPTRRRQHGVPMSLGRRHARRWHSSSEAVGELDLQMEEENDGRDGDEEAEAGVTEEENEGEQEEEREEDRLTNGTSVQGEINGASMYYSRMARMSDVAGGRVDDGAALSPSPFVEEVARAEASPTIVGAGANENEGEGLNGAVPDRGGVEVASPSSVSSEMDLAAAKPGWEPTGTRLPHWIQFHLPKEKRVGFGPATSVAAGAPPALMHGKAKALLQQWRALELEQRDYQNNTPKVLEISAGRLPSGASLPLPASSLRSVRIIEQVNHRQTGWLSLVNDVDLEEGEDVVQVLFSANFGADEVSTKTGRFRVLARTRISVEQIQAQLHMTELLPALVAIALAHAEDRSFLRTVTFFFRRFYPADTASLPALANSEYDLARGQAAGITFSEDGKWATFPFGPKLLVSTLNSSEGILRWVFRSSGNSSWAVGAIPASKIDRHDVMMAEQSLAVATTGLAGGRIALRKEIQKRNVEAVIDVQAGHLILTVENNQDSPILLPLPPDSQEPYHLAAMGYSNTVIHFLDKL